MNKKKSTGSGPQDAIELVPGVCLQLIAESLFAGTMAGAAVSLLRLGLEKTEFLREELLERAKVDTAFAPVLLALLAGVFLMICLCLKLSSYSAGSGIPQVKGELRGSVSQPWLSTLCAKLLGTVAGIGAGLSMGNEGPSVQIGAMAGKGFSRIARRTADTEKLLMTSGAGAGLAGAFSAPLAGVIFALEDIRGDFSRVVLASALTSCVAADFVTKNIFGLRPVLRVDLPAAIPLRCYGLLLILGVILGISGVFFNWFTDFMQDQYDRIRSRYVRVAVPVFCLIPVAVFFPKTMGTGYSLIREAADGKLLLSSLAVLLVVKFFFSMICTTSGAQGGIFLPLLVNGALTGGLFAAAVIRIGWIDPCYTANFVMLGMVGYFAAVIRAPITGIILITELTGGFQNFLSFCLVALIAAVTAAFMGGRPIYDQLLDRMLGYRPAPASAKKIPPVY
jgi:H+/Cl- antiporter ClcA